MHGLSERTGLVFTLGPRARGYRKIMEGTKSLSYQGASPLSERGHPTRRLRDSQASEPQRVVTNSAEGLET